MPDLMTLREGAGRRRMSSREGPRRNETPPKTTHGQRIASLSLSTIHIIQAPEFQNKASNSRGWIASGNCRVCNLTRPAPNPRGIFQHFPSARWAAIRLPTLHERIEVSRSPKSSSTRAQGTLEIWHIDPGRSLTAATCFAAAFILEEDAEVYPLGSQGCVDLNFCEEFAKLPKTVWPLSQVSQVKTGAESRLSPD
jgi:hypothetical protein